MKKIINYEKDILFKTNIGEISSISLEHDFTLGENVLKGDFLITGEYKPNELSINKEPFEYRLPLEYELADTVDLDSLTYDIDDFEYTVKDDCLTVYIDFAVRYEEKKNEPVIPSITESDLNASDDCVETTVELPKMNREFAEPSKEEEPVPIEDEPKIDPEIAIEPTITDCDDERLDDVSNDTIIEAFTEEDEYITYHVHIVRAGDTLESIAEKYNCTAELIKKYNEFDTIEEKMKLLIPESEDE